MLSVADIKEKSIELGFDLLGVAPAAGFPELQFLRKWIDQGYGADMHYMARTAEKRSDVRHVLPSAKSVIVTGTNYNVDRPYSTEYVDSTTAKLARYAWGDDYHKVIGDRLEMLLEWMRERCELSFEARAYVDTGPVQERVYAQYAGLGWIGKNTCLINEDFGSWLFLSEIICSLPLAPTMPAMDQCGDCNLCLEACPTDALVEPWVLDSERCLSYLTIELKDKIPEAMREAIGAHVYGCDICQEVCPWNSGAPVSEAHEWSPRKIFDRPSLSTLWHRSDADFRDGLRRSAMKRTGVSGLRRNLAVAIGNSEDGDTARAFNKSLEIAKNETSSLEPVVNEHIRWAKRRLKNTS